MLISFSGSSSSGKSTLLQKCKENYNHNFTCVEEITRKIKAKGFNINEAGDDITQILIINSHIENSLIQNAILDRCALDGLIYTKYLYYKGQVRSSTVETAEIVYNYLIPKYDVIFYTEPLPLIDDGIRSISTSFREITIQLFEEQIKKDTLLASKIVRLSGSVDERMDIIDDKIKQLTKSN